MTPWGKIELIWLKVAYNGPIYVPVVRYDKFWPYLCLYYQFWHIMKLSCKFDHIAITMPSKCVLVNNRPQWYYMSCCSEVYPFMATFHTAQHILVNFDPLILNFLRMSFGDKEWQILHNMASSGPVWPLLATGDHVWSSLWSMNDLDRIEAEMRNLGHRYQVIAGMALWGKIEHICSKVVYNGPIYVRVTRHDKFRPY